MASVEAGEDAPPCPSLLPTEEKRTHSISSSSGGPPSPHGKLNRARTHGSHQLAAVRPAPPQLVRLTGLSKLPDVMKKGRGTKSIAAEPLLIVNRPSPPATHATECGPTARRKDWWSKEDRGGAFPRQNREFQRAQPFSMWMIVGINNKNKHGLNLSK